MTRCLIAFLSFHSHKGLAKYAKLARFFIMLSCRQKMIIMENLKIAFPNKAENELKVIMKKSVESNMMTFLEFFWISKNPEKVTELVSIDSASTEVLDNLAKEDKATLYICPHIGNWELGNIAVNAMGYPTRPVARVLKHKEYDELITSIRQMTGASVIKGKGGARSILKALRSKELVLMLVDQNVKPHKGGFFVDFFGLPVAISRAPASLALKTKSNVLMGYCIRQNDGKLKIFVERLDQELVACENDEALSQEFTNKSVEIIARYPEQYLWMYERYRYIPKDWEDKSAYPFYATLAREKGNKADLTD